MYTRYRTDLLATKSCGIQGHVHFQIIYVARNPKDAVVSYYHHHRLWNGYIGSFEDFFDAFINDRGKSH